MCRCDCCNKVLDDYETTLRHAVTGEFLNTCSKCLKGLGIPKKGRADLKPRQTKEEDYLRMDPVDRFMLENFDEGD